MTIRVHKQHLKDALGAPLLWLKAVSFAVLYVALSVLAVNYRLVFQTLTDPFTLSQKLSLLLSLLQGVSSLYSPVEVILISLLGVLMGLNLFVILGVRKQEKQTKGVLSAGIASLGVVVSTGCASCGLTLLSLAGPTVSLSLMPFNGWPLQAVSGVLLTVSLLHTINRKNAACVITRD